MTQVVIESTLYFICCTYYNYTHTLSNSVIKSANIDCYKYYNYTATDDNLCH